MDRPLVAVILAGGTGTRLYPASRPDRPKQFLELGGGRSLFARTVDRSGFVDQQYAVARPAYADRIREHAPGVGVFEEPAPKDTGPALVYAAHRIRQQVDDCVLVCLPSDHHIAGDFEATARRAARAAVDTDGLVTVGVHPSRPATEYGYIAPGDTERSGEPSTGFPVEQFVEKPDEASAREYIEAGYYWNAGIFAWTPGALLRAARDSPLAPLVTALAEGDPVRGFDAVSSVSVDTAILEDTAELSVVPASFEWDDLGSWDALGRVRETDVHGNVRIGETLTEDTEDSILATDGHVTTVGVSGLVVASFDGRTIVVPRSDCQRVREVVARLRAEGDRPGEGPGG